MTAAGEAARRWFAEDLRISCNVQAPALLDAFATIPRERFLGPAPWTIRGAAEGGPYTLTSADPTAVYHNVSVALDASRDLYNGQPGLIARWLEDLAIRPGSRVLHIGAGTGYFTAILGQLVGPAGRVWAIEVDTGLAGRATANLADWPWVTVQAGDGRAGLPAPVDVVLIQAGGTHVLDEWLDTLADGGRLLLPLTATIPAMGPHLGKGPLLRLTRHEHDWVARVSSLVAIYSLVGHRDDAMNAALGQALLSGALFKATRLRRDRHAPSPGCLLHGPTTCLSA